MIQSSTINRSPGKSGLEETGIDWHADGGGFAHLQPQSDFVTVFVALTACHRENGCLEYQPSSRDKFFMELDAGQFSLHSSSIQHHAIRNASSQHRTCIAF